MHSITACANASLVDAECVTGGAIAGIGVSPHKIDGRVAGQAIDYTTILDCTGTAGDIGTHPGDQIPRGACTLPIIIDHKAGQASQADRCRDAGIAAWYEILASIAQLLPIIPTNVNVASMAVTLVGRNIEDPEFCGVAVCAVLGQGPITCHAPIVANSCTEFVGGVCVSVGRARILIDAVLSGDFESLTVAIVAVPLGDPEIVHHDRIHSVVRDIV